MSTPELPTDPSASADTVNIAGQPGQVHPNGRRSGFWTRTKIIVSGTIAVVGAVTGVMSVIPILTRDATNFGSLELTALTASDHVTEWALPQSALSDESLSDVFPTGDASCSPEQLEWLQSHAEPLANRFAVSMHNTAAEGPMLALQDFAAVGASEGTSAEIIEEGPASIRVICDTRDGSQELIQVARVDVDQPGSVARFVRATTNGQPLPETPVSWNVAPGETGSIEFQLHARLGTSGQLAAAVTSRGETREFIVEDSTFDMPPLLYAGDLFLRATPDGLRCQRVEQTQLIDCAVNDARAELAERNAQ